MDGLVQSGYAVEMTYTCVYPFAVYNLDLAGVNATGTLAPAVASLLEAALAYHGSRQPARAIATYGQAERVWSELAAGEPPLIGRLFLWNAIGSVHESAGNDEEALANFMDAKTLASQLPSNHPDTALALANIGAICYHWGHFELALRCFEDVMHTRETVLGKKHVDTAAAWNNVGCCLDCIGRTEEARFRFQQAVRCLKPQLRLEHPRVTVASRNLQRNQHKPAELHLGANLLTALPHHLPLWG